MNNKWKPISKLGQGEHGLVYLVEGTVDGAKNYAALKKVPRSSKLINDFEFSDLHKLNHPNIIKILEIETFEESNEHDESCEIVLEYASKGDLSVFSKIKYGKTHIPQEILLKWLCELSLGLHYLHNEVRVLHRDIKLKNILVMENGMLKIADFGTARQLKRHEEFAMTSVGTPCYLSPEAVRGPKYDNKSDVWGLGCIMVELCTGKKPFQGNNLSDLIKQILSSEVEEIPEVYSDWFRNLIKSMLEKVPEKRPSIESILERAEIRQAFQELKQEYETEYKEFTYPISMSELKTKKYCEREEKSRSVFCSETLKTVKNEKNIKLDILDWKNDGKVKNKKETKIADISKFKNRSLKSVIEMRNNKKKELEETDKFHHFETNQPKNKNLQIE